ncbi:apolipoprotein N-acyltransferase [uncultured Cellulomonas sp.]|uniref:apolipoprotein N-acyltransferase n=1 Tax=uncultured Cellulomonas sp. TaxID=189682 RepID=UPI00260F6DBD|nr:apolipoprotein N-acyltransferase [uncultured Cellulomonas sp.]
MSATGGLLTETAFPSKSWWAMAYVGVALLAVAVRHNSARWGFAVGSAFGLGLFLPHLWWANEAVGQPIGWLALAIAEAGAIGVLAAAAALVWRVPVIGTRLWLQCVSFAVLWVAVEHLRSTVPFGGFPWATLAFSQTDSPLLRLAPLGGSTLVSFIVALIGAVLGTVITAALSRNPATAVTGAVLCIATTSLPLLVPVSTGAQTGTVNIGAVQGNVPARGAEAMSQARAVLDNHAAGTRALLERLPAGQLDLLLWPESASDIDPRTDQDARAVVQAAARAAGVPIMLGTQRFLEDTRYNDYIVWEPAVGATASYTKQHPVPFGEYIPYRDFFRRITPAVDLVRTDMTAGTDPAPIGVPIERLGRSVPISVAICFEVAYDDLIRQSVLAGGELIVIPTNNASFGMTQESTQQLAMSRFRAAEHGRAVVQVSTVGVSALIRPDGSTVDRTSLFTADQMSAQLPLRTSLTPSDRIGARLPLAVDALALVFIAGAGAHQLRGKTGRRQVGARGA